MWMCENIHLVRRSIILHLLFKNAYLLIPLFVLSAIAVLSSRQFRMTSEAGENTVEREIVFSSVSLL